MMKITSLFAKITKVANKSEREIGHKCIKNYEHSKATRKNCLTKLPKITTLLIKVMNIASKQGKEVHKFNKKRNKITSLLKKIINKERGEAVVFVKFVSPLLLICYVRYFCNHGR